MRLKHGCDVHKLRHIAEDSTVTLHSRRHKNLKSHKLEELQKLI
jgi:hypothetical protein